MKELDISSNITFLYYKDFAVGKTFVEDVLGLDMVLDTGWACVYRIKDKSFLGVVNVEEGSIEVKNKGGFLISLTVANIEECYGRIKSFSSESVNSITEIKDFEEINLKSFFFKCPEGNDFEIQQFTNDEMNELFG